MPIAERKQASELLDPGLLTLRLAAAVKQAGVELLRHQRVLKALGEPIDHGHHHVEVHVVAHLAAPLAVLHEVERAVGVLAHEEPVDLALELEVCAVVADQHDPVRHPVLLDQVLGALQPVVEGVEEASLDDLLRRVQPRRKREDRLLVRLEEQPGLAAEVLEHRALRDAELRRHVLDSGPLIAVFGEVAHRRLDDRLALRLRPRTSR